MLIRCGAPVGLALGPHRYDEGMGANHGCDRNYWLQRESKESDGTLAAWRTPDNTVRPLLARLSLP